MICARSALLNGQAIGPYTPPSSQLPTIRTIGYRRTGRQLAPILHAKLALLGHLWWHDEGPLGEVDDVIGFAAGRLWVSSANFTTAFRDSLEVGYWTEDRSLLQGAGRFLIELMRSSEGLDPAADSSDPDLAPYEFDDDAMAEAATGTDWDDD